MPLTCIISVSIDLDLATRLQKALEVRGLNRSEAIRQAVERWLSSPENADAATGTWEDDLVDGEYA